MTIHEHVYFVFFGMHDFLLCRYLLDLNKESREIDNPSKQAVIDQWVEWDSTSLQVSQSALGFRGSGDTQH